VERIEGKEKVHDIEEERGDAESALGRGIRAVFGRIVRDEEGKVIRVELEEEEDVDQEMKEVELDRVEMNEWVRNLGEEKGESRVVQALERVSVKVKQDGRTMGIGDGDGRRRKRHVSVGEAGYLRKLVQQHGMDVETMARDRKLNPEQRTAGSLRRALLGGD